MTELNSGVAKVVYIIETNQMSPAMACRENNVDRYEVEQARQQLEPGHVFENGQWVKRPVWVRKVR